MRNTFTLNPDLVDDVFKEKNRHLGEFYHRIGFRNNPNLLDARSDGKPAHMGTLLIGDVNIDLTRGQATGVMEEIRESLYGHSGRSGKHRPGSVQQADSVFIYYKEYQLTIAEANKIKDLLQDAIKVHDMTVKFGL